MYTRNMKPHLSPAFAMPFCVRYLMRTGDGCGFEAMTRSVTAFKSTIIKILIVFIILIVRAILLNENLNKHDMNNNHNHNDK